MSEHRYPPAKLTWYKNNALVSTSYDTIESKTEALLQVKVEPTDNKVVYRCDAINQAIDSPLSTNIALNVLYGPTNVILNGVFEAKAGENITASCASDTSNPESRLSFIFDGAEYQPLMQIKTNGTNGGTLLNSTFAFTVNREHNGKEFKCFVENRVAGIQKSVAKSVSVLYPPETIDLAYSEENKTITEGRKVRLTCKVKGGYPTAEIEWYIGNNKPLARTKLIALSTQTFLSTTESTLELVLKREHHNQPIECIATNKVTSLKKSVNLLVSCKLHLL